MKETDSLQRFIFEEANIRGEIVHLKEAFQRIIQQRTYPPFIQHILGEALVSTLLITSSIKFKGHLSLQFQGDSRLPLLLAQCDDQLHIRGFAKYQENLPIESYAESFLQGKMVITINQDNQTQSYQSLVPINSTSMGENLMHYFAQSEQIATKVWLAVDGSEASGMILQLMPGEDSGQKEQFWEYAVQLGQTVTEQELLTIDNSTLLYRLYNEAQIRLFDSRPVQFKCRCNKNKITQLISVLGEQEAMEVLQEKGHIEITCDFCNQQYLFDSIDVALVFRK